MPLCGCAGIWCESPTADRLWFMYSLNLRREHRHVAMKIGAYHALSSELSVSRYLNTVRTSHPGSILVRQMLDEFEVTRRGHRYQAIVYAPLAITLRGFRKLFASQSLSVDLLKLVLQHIFIALDFLYTDARVIHTGKSSAHQVRIHIVYIA